MSGPYETAICMLEEAYRRNSELNILPATDNLKALQNELILRDRTCLANALRLLKAAEKVDERDLGRIFMGFVSTEMRELLETIKIAKGGKDA